MPEIAEVARATHYIRKHLVGRTLTKVTAVDDPNVFGKVGTSGDEIMKRITGKKVVSAGSQGKYFWIVMSSPPHLVMHFGMSGWLHFKSEHTYYYRKTDDKVEEWPPKFWKLLLEANKKGEGESIDAAYVDMRRFGRIRLVDCEVAEIRNVSPLVENGPDPVVDKEKVTAEWLKDLCQKKKVPIKAMLLDQANISGIGNWVGDEIMYDAKIHPEQYANTLLDDQIERIHKSIHYICGTAVDLLGDSDQFPKHWLFKHRWGKGKKDAPKTLPNGNKIVFLTVGGRTSAVVPAEQKKTGPVAKEMSEAEEDEKQPNKATKRAAVQLKDESDEKADSMPAKRKKVSKGQPQTKSEDDDKQSELTNEATTMKGPKRSSKTKNAKQKDATMTEVAQKAGPEEKNNGRRRSGRLQR